MESLKITSKTETSTISTIQSIGLAPSSSNLIILVIASSMMTMAAASLNLRRLREFHRAETACMWAHSYVGFECAPKSRPSKAMPAWQAGFAVYRTVFPASICRNCEIIPAFLNASRFPTQCPAANIHPVLRNHLGHGGKFAATLESLCLGCIFQVLRNSAAGIVVSRYPKCVPADLFRVHSLVLRFWQMD